MIKGGVWKNTEDEILKAAVMKYGLNQWARISSLLVRKSAKQCKARWYEWLDPSIKKTEWTREEDEKLLHLAKLMPTQWRTIAPIVGRTPSQCLERYEKLLDAAAAKDDGYDAADDPRRLRPGEIDPNPEAKPARPDPMDMDEDEKEMLSEARARLANTKGKKAKRKAREKQLEEARRLASLQKKRELRAAGIDQREMQRRTRGINYNEEVAFEKKPQAGFHDTRDEVALTREVGKQFRPATVEQIEGRKDRLVSEELMKKDEQHSKLQMAHNAPVQVAKAIAMNDATMQRKRGRMMLPAPQISEAELEAIARGGGQADLGEQGEGGTDASRRLLGDYETPQRFATPQRTPRAEGMSGRDRVLAEAINLQKLSSTQTPLMGGENPDMGSGDFGGITPRNTVPVTPHSLAGMTPGAQTPAVGATPAGGRSVAGIAATPGRSIAGTPSHTPGGGTMPGRTPLRDQLGLNDPDAAIAAETRRAEKARLAAARGDLRAGLSSLPAPANEYMVQIPDLPEGGDGNGEAMDEDAADVKARQQAAEAARVAAELKLRSQVLQRGLPRPAAVTVAPTAGPAAVGPAAAGAREQAERLIANELGTLLAHDNAAYPVVAGGRKDRKRKKAEAAAAEVPTLERFEAAELDAARLLLEEETSVVRQAMGHDHVGADEVAVLAEAARKDFIWLPGNPGRYSRAAAATNSDRLASVQGEFEGVVSEMEKEAARALKLDHKVVLLTRGLTDREAKLAKATGDLVAENVASRQELACFRALAVNEEAAARRRRAAAQEAVAAQRRKEEELQARYKELSSLHRDQAVLAA